MSNRVLHGTLTGNAVTTLTLDKDYNAVEVLARGTLDIYARTDKVNPAVGGADSWVCVAGGFVIIPVSTAGATEVRLISSGAAPYSVTGVM